ncbi:hypothetical protein EV368DRAFT_50261, partial [Lentinula lateritia]
LWIVDYIETLPAELRSIWKKKTGISVLFLVNRYTFLLFIVLGALLNFPGNGTDMQCQAGNIMLSISQTIALFTTNALFALRVYAIYNKNIVILEIALVFIILRFVLDIWSAVIELGVSTIGSSLQNFSRCAGAPNDAVAFNQSVHLSYLCNGNANWLGYNILIFVLTAIKTAQHAVEMKRMGQSSITQVIIRDGKCWQQCSGKIIQDFLIFLNLFLHSIICKSIFHLIGHYILFKLFCRLPNLLISRLMLNLHTYSAASQGQQTNVSSMKFAFSAPLNGESFNEGGDEAIEMDNFRREYERPVEA